MRPSYLVASSLALCCFVAVHEVRAQDAPKGPAGQRQPPPAAQPPAAPNTKPNAKPGPNAPEANANPQPGPLKKPDFGWDAEAPPAGERDPAAIGAEKLKRAAAVEDAANDGPALVLQRVEYAVKECDAAELSQELGGASSLERIIAYESFVRNCPKSPASPMLYEEAFLLRELVVRQLDEVGEPPPPPEGAMRELPFDLAHGKNPPGKAKRVIEPARAPAPAAIVRAPNFDSEPVHEIDHPRVNYHDGFVFRVATGGSYYFGNFSARASSCTSCSDSTSLIGPLRGGAFDTEMILAGNLNPGVVFGLRGTVSVPMGWSFKPDPAPESSLGSRPFALGSIGLVVDWYPDPGGGFHMMFAPAAAFATIRDAQNRLPSELQRGMLIATAIGFEGWIGENWSFGAEATADFGYMVTTSSSSFGFAAPGGRFTLTYD